MNTGTMIANAVTAGKSFRIRTTGKGFNQALAQLKASLGEESAPVADVTKSKQVLVCGTAVPGGRMRRMFLFPIAEVAVPVVEQEDEQEGELVCDTATPLNCMRRMFLSGKDRSVRVIKL